MSHLLDDDDDDLHGHSKHRELTLSTGTVLGIFLGLALSWALFFGFGYNMGSKARQAAQVPAADTSAEPAASSTSFNNFKPAPGSPTGSYPTTPAPSGPQSPVTTVPPASAAPATSTTPADPTAATEKPTPISLHPVSPAATPAPPASNGAFVVQIAAVSHKEDAGYLVTALRGKGYAVTAQPGSDNLIHVQVGPFATHKEADSMRQQLLSDGYNAIVK